ncbi:hypothetical protein HDU98_010793 [Podochytrium sp. JEL0797]|nr:hypothetical protein HDU98_010793 [Podochytrium sp. JEL0797]
MPATLYYTATSCGASNFIAAHRAGILNKSLNAYQANIYNKTVATGPNKGSDFFKINPKGNVPTIVLEDGTVLNENAATLQWIADHAVTKVGAANGTNARYLLQSKLSYISSEVHGSYGPLFNPALAPEVRQWALDKLATKLKYLNDVELADGRKFWVGNDFTVADSYLYIVLGWSGYLKVDLSVYPKVQAYHAGIAALDFVKEAHALMTAETPAAEPTSPAIYIEHVTTITSVHLATLFPSHTPKHPSNGIDEDPQHRLKLSIATLLRHTGVCGPVVFIALYYMSQFMVETSEFEWGVAVEDQFGLLVVALVVSCKIHDDDRISNSIWSELSGMALQELNEAEWVFLEALGFRCHLGVGEYEEMKRGLELLRA